MVEINKTYIALAAFLLVILIALYLIVYAFLDLINKIPEKKVGIIQMTDLEKFEALFDDIGIEYKISFKVGEGKRIILNPEMMCCNYGYALQIMFDLNGQFTAFYPIGESYENRRH